MKTTLLACLALAGLFTESSLASTGKSEAIHVHRDSSGVQLPRWEAEEAYESFDVRIWPEAVILWLEQENMRDIIADPSTPEKERNELKRILAMQNAWRTS
ncbi:MAG: hypothetical protein AAF733_02345 [Verrucomicrobiota bacterium]